MRQQWLSGAVAAGMVLMAASAHAVARDDIVGSVRVHTAVWEDTLLDLARSNDLGYVEIVAANPGIDPWVPGTGTKVVMPTAHILPDAPRTGIVLNLPEMRLYHFRGGSVATYPIGIGQDGKSTPLGATSVVRKKAGPTWYPPASVRRDKPYLPASVPPGPENPLGTHAIYLGWPAYLIHGTNKPDGVGRRVSYGCVRMYPEHIVELYGSVAAGAPVRVVNQPVKAGWRGGELFLEVHPTLNQVDQMEIDGRLTHDPLPNLHSIVEAAAGAEASRVDWATVERVAAERRGLPVRISRDDGMAQTY